MVPLNLAETVVDASMEFIPLWYALRLPAIAEVLGTAAGTGRSVDCAQCPPGFVPPGSVECCPGDDVKSGAGSAGASALSNASPASCATGDRAALDRLCPALPMDALRCVCEADVPPFCHSAPPRPAFHMLARNRRG